LTFASDATKILLRSGLQPTKLFKIIRAAKKPRKKPPKYHRGLMPTMIAKKSPPVDSVDTANQMHSVVLDDWSTVQVYRSSEGWVSWANPKTKRLEYFRTMAEAQREISLESMGLRCTFVHHEYLGNLVTIYASVFVQSPDEIIDEMRCTSGFIVEDLDWIAYFLLGGQWHCADSIESAKDLFNSMIDTENNGENK
jgi:hypothetical protein